MNPSPKQLPLDLALAPDLGKQAFLAASSNAEARIALDRQKWANNALALVGPEGCGKTHLGHIWSENRGAIAVDGREVFQPKTAWKGRALWIDNASKADEFALFASINMAVLSEIDALLLTDTLLPTNWDVQISDLHSRLKNIQVARIEEPDDDLLTAIVEKLFADRGLKVSDTLISFILTNTERSVDAVRQLILELDAAAAVEKVNVTRSFAAKYLRQRDGTA